MNTLNKFTYWREPVILVLFVGLLFAHKCEPDDLKSDKKELNKVLDGVKVIQKRHKILVDSLKTDNLKKDKLITELRTNTTILETTIINNKKALKEKQKVIIKYSIQQSAQYIADRYKTKSVTTENNSVVLRDSVPNQIISELEEKDALEQDTYDYLKIIDNKNGEIKLGEGKLLNKDLELASKNIEAEVLQTGLNKSLDLNIKTEAALKRSKNGNTWKWVGIGAAAVGGFFIGKGVSK